MILKDFLFGSILNFWSDFMMTFSKSKNYENLSRFIKRRISFSCAHSISHLLLEKFSTAQRPTDWQYICAKDLKDRKIISNNSYKTFSAWREEMVRNGILICMASKKDIESNKEAIYQASKFKYSLDIKKYIEAELHESIFERLDSKADNERVDKIENLINSKVDNNRVEFIEEKFEELEKKVENLTAMILKAIPPDTPERRKIVSENISNQEKCFELLKNDPVN